MEGQESNISRLKSIVLETKYPYVPVIVIV
jgi:hypothetical protein